MYSVFKSHSYYLHCFMKLASTRLLVRLCASFELVCYYSSDNVGVTGKLCKEIYTVTPGRS